MKSIPRISDTEWEVMRIVWAQHPLTASEVIAQLTASDPTWHPKTVRTLLARLVQKKALGYTAKGQAYLYSPLVDEQQCVAAASDSFLTRVFGGSLEPMLAHFVSRQRLSPTELTELRRLLEETSKTNQSRRKT
jgi:BlaI family penicillinase repressor